jgi:hypothetical protein
MMLYQNIPYFYDYELKKFITAIIAIICFTILFILVTFPLYIIRFYNNGIVLTIRVQGKKELPMKKVLAMRYRYNLFQLRFGKKNILYNDIIGIYAIETTPEEFKRYLYGLFRIEKGDGTWFHFNVNTLAEFNAVLNQFATAFGQRWQYIFKGRYIRKSSLPPVPP